MRRANGCALTATTRTPALVSPFAAEPLTWGGAGRWPRHVSTLAFWTHPHRQLSQHASTALTCLLMQALKLAKGLDQTPWFFSRGVYRPGTQTMVPYAELGTGNESSASLRASGTAGLRQTGAS